MDSTTLDRAVSCGSGLAPGRPKDDRPRALVANMMREAQLAGYNWASKSSLLETRNRGGREDRTPQDIHVAGCWGWSRHRDIETLKST